MSELLRIDLELDPAWWTTANTHRTPGLHLTDIIRDYSALLHHGPESGQPQRPQDLARARAFWIQGYLWEDAMTETLRNRVRRTDGIAIGAEDYVRLQEIAVRTDGREAFFVEYDEVTGKLLTPIPKGFVLMTPDGCRLQPLRLLELKWTTKSVAMNPETDRRDWFVQASCYLLGLSHALGEEVSEVEWHVQFPCGDWRGSGVRYQRWEKQFAWQQIVDKWDSLMNFVQQRAGEPGHPWRDWL